MQCNCIQNKLGGNTVQEEHPALLNYPLKAARNGII